MSVLAIVVACCTWSLLIDLRSLSSLASASGCWFCCARSVLNCAHWSGAIILRRNSLASSVGKASMFVSGLHAAFKRLTPVATCWPDFFLQSHVAFSRQSAHPWDQLPARVHRHSTELRRLSYDLALEFGDVCRQLRPSFLGQRPRDDEVIDLQHSRSEKLASGTAATQARCSLALFHLAVAKLHLRANLRTTRTVVICFALAC